MLPANLAGGMKQEVNTGATHPPPDTRASVTVLTRTVSLWGGARGQGNIMGRNKDPGSQPSPDVFSTEPGLQEVLSVT